MLSRSFCSSLFYLSTLFASLSLCLPFLFFFLLLPFLFLSFPSFLFLFATTVVCCPPLLIPLFPSLSSTLHHTLPPLLLCGSHTAIHSLLHCNDQPKGSDPSFVLSSCPSEVNSPLPFTPTPTHHPPSGHTRPHSNFQQPNTQQRQAETGTLLPPCLLPPSLGKTRAQPPTRPLFFLYS